MAHNIFTVYSTTVKRQVQLKCFQISLKTTFCTNPIEFQTCDKYGLRGFFAQDYNLTLVFFKCPLPAWLLPHSSL